MYFGRTEEEIMLGNLIKEVTSMIDSIEDGDDSKRISEIMMDVESVIDSRVETIIKYVREETKETTKYKMDEINSSSDEELIEMISEDKEVMDWIIDPSQEVKDYYNFKYKL